MNDPLKVCIIGKPNFMLAYTMAHLINDGHIVIAPDPDKLQGCEIDFCWIDDFDVNDFPCIALDSACQLIETKAIKFELPDPIEDEDLIFAKERKEHLKKCQPWKRKKKGRS